MQVQVKLFATLRKRLPPGATAGKTTLSLSEGTTILGVIRHLQIPQEMAHMVLVNGEQTHEFDRALAEGDSLSIFPPVAGGIQK